MKIRFWGSRGSIPVSGPEYIRYGGDTTCVEIRTVNDEIIIIDCGTGLRRLGNLLRKEKRTEMSIVFTHAHWDHIIAFPFFTPIYNPATKINFYGCPFAQGSIRSILTQAMQAPFFPVKLDDAKAQFIFHDSCVGSFSIDSVRLDPVLLSHPNEGLGYSLIEGEKRFVFLTDNELACQHPGGLQFDDYAAFCKGADLLVHDAEFTAEEYSRIRGWGHSTYQQALELALAAGVGTLGLFHHNRDRTDDQLDLIVADCRRIIAERGSSLQVFAVTQETAIDL